MSKLPDFNGAVDKLMEFLISNHWPTSIIWVRALNEEIDLYHRLSEGELDKRIYSRSLAEADYLAAIAANLGVAFEGLMHNEVDSYIMITKPKNEMEAEYLIYSKELVKYSLRM